MALGRIVKFKRSSGAKRKVWINRVTKRGRMYGRYCVKTHADSKRRVFKGASTLRFYGCFKMKSKAQAAANKLAHKASVK